MEKGNIKIVEIADFKNSEHVLDYVDNDFVIINSLEGSPYNEDTIRLGCFLIAICLEGCIQLDVNYKTYQYQPRDGKPKAQDKACRILHTVPTTRGQDGEGYMEYRYAYPQQSHKVCRGGRGQGNLQILPGTAYGKDKRRASSLSQGSDAILVFCHFL